MKTLIINIKIIVSFLLLSQLSLSQYPSVFGNTSTSWNILQRSSGINRIDSLFTAGIDTTINGKTYKQLNSYKIINSTTKLLNSGSHFMREDTSNGRVWLRNSIDTSELLISDLSLSLGDTLFFGESNNGIVDSVYFLGGKKHVRLNYFTYSNCNDFRNEKYTMIEGVGFINDLTRTLSSETCNYLLCKKNDGVVLYQNTNTNYTGYCSSNFLGKNEKMLKNRFKIYPNPANTFITIENTESIRIKKIQLININGSIIKKEINGTNKIDLSLLENGIYYILIETERGSIVKKVIVNHF